MSTHSRDGREWARLSTLKFGDRLLCDDGFTCGIAGKTVTVGDDGSLFVRCLEGRHRLVGQCSDIDNDHLVGMWPAPTEDG